MKKHSSNQVNEEILDILTETPAWVVRVGAGILTFIICLFFVGAWIIKYPEVLKGDAVVATQTPMIRVVAPTGGRILRLFVKNDAGVKKGDVIAETENTTRLENISVMQQLIGQTRGFLQNSSRSIDLPDPTLVWGDLQQDYNLLRHNYLEFKRLESQNYHHQQVKNIRSQANELQQLAALNERQKSINEEEYAINEACYKNDEALYNEGLYSKMEFMQSKNKILGKKREREEFNKEGLNLRLKITELERDVQNIQHELAMQKQTCLDLIDRSVDNIENCLRHWQKNYLITAPADGKLVFLKNLSENQFVRTSDTLFAVLPGQEQYVATVEIPVRGMGKAQVGQKVIVKLYDYPYQEFGMLEGEVLSLEPSLNLKSYRVMVALPKGLRSTFNKDFTCRSELTGTAEIVTADMRLLERVFYGLRKLLM
jgi:multidrug efflux pump subunit AcrA (membrane-fusion protein)